MTTRRDPTRSEDSLGKVYAGRRWRTRRAIELPDRRGGNVRVRAEGTYAFRILDPDRLAATLIAAGEPVSPRRASARLGGRISERMDVVIRRLVVKAEDLPLVFNEVATEARLELKHEFARLGVDLIDFFISAIRPSSGGPVEAPNRRRPAPQSLHLPVAPAPADRRPRRTAAEPPSGARPIRVAAPCPVCGAPLAGTAPVCPRCGASRHRGRGN